MVNIKAAILSLASFRQSWCYDEKLKIHSCDFCEFQNENKDCALKQFVYNHNKGYAKKIQTDILDI